MLLEGILRWALIPPHYVQEIYQNVQKYVKNIGGIWKLLSPKQAPNPFPMVNAPELDTYNVLDPLLVSYYKSQTGF